MARLGVRSISIGIVALASGFILKSVVTQADPAEPGLLLRPTLSGVSVFGTIHPDLIQLRTPIGTQIPSTGIKVASLDPSAGLDAVADEDAAAEPAEEGYRLASFNERFDSFDLRAASFDERFGPAGREITGSVQPPLERSVQKAVARPMGKLPSAAPAGPTLASVSSMPAPEPAKKHIRPGQERPEALAPSEDDGRTAIYDISARTVYLPSGRRLTAHSGLGSLMDDPRHVHVRMQGATPPNVYRLTLREQLFHGVRAIRLNPVDESRMHGRAGILAHSYMLGPNGQSNGCVSFEDYPAFLRAFERGEVTRLVVVDRLDNAPGPKVAAAGGWLPDALKNIFKSND